jgi:hypothetical protein
MRKRPSEIRNRSSVARKLASETRNRTSEMRNGGREWRRWRSETRIGAGEIARAGTSMWTVKAPIPCSQATRREGQGTTGGK